MADSISPSLLVNTPRPHFAVPPQPAQVSCSLNPPQRQPSTRPTQPAPSQFSFNTYQTKFTGPKPLDPRFTPSFPLQTPPLCPHCKVNTHSIAYRHIRRADLHRELWVCLKCREKLICFNDSLGISRENPTCSCGMPKRANYETGEVGVFAWCLL